MIYPEGPVALGDLESLATAEALNLQFPKITRDEAQIHAPFIPGKGNASLAFVAWGDRGRIVTATADYTSQIPFDSDVARYAQALGQEFIDAKGRRLPLWPSRIQQEVNMMLPALRRVLITTVDGLGDAVPQVVSAQIASVRNKQAPTTSAKFTTHLSPQRTLHHEGQLIAQRLQTRRQLGGVKIWDNQDAGFVSNRMGLVDAIPDRERQYSLYGITFANRVVQRELAIAHNIAVTLAAHRHRVPLIYTGHAYPKTFDATHFEADLAANDLTALQTLGQVSFATTPQQHDALGLETYATWDRPDISFADFVNLANLRALMQNRTYPSPFPYPPEQLADITRRLNEIAELQLWAREYALDKSRYRLAVARLGTSAAISTIQDIAYDATTAGRPWHMLPAKGSNRSGVVSAPNRQTEPKALELRWFG